VPVEQMRQEEPPRAQARPSLARPWDGWATAPLRSKAAPLRLAAADRPLPAVGRPFPAAWTAPPTLRRAR
jgi:hypothetical protein